MLNLLRRKIFKRKVARNAFYAARCKDCAWHTKNGMCYKDLSKTDLNLRKDWCGDYTEN